MLICETVNICNNSCIMCPYDQMTRSKQAMSMSLFKKVLSDYSEIGGGKLSLTPVVGEVFLDSNLVERIKLMRDFPSITGVSITTNASAVERVNNQDLASIVNGLERIHISIYGIDAQEYTTITRRNTFDCMLNGIRRIVEARTNNSQISLGFRLLKHRTQAEIEDWIQQTCKYLPDYGLTYSYANWAGSIDTAIPLPFDGKWISPQKNYEQCLIPLIAVQVFSDGRVSFCPCPDYDANPELSLGSISTTALAEIINSSRNCELWDFSSHMPEICKGCTFHKNLNDQNQLKLLLNDPNAYIGG